MERVGGIVATETMQFADRDGGMPSAGQTRASIADKMSSSGKRRADRSIGARLCRRVTGIRPLQEMISHPPGDTWQELMAGVIGRPGEHGSERLGPAVVGGRQ